VLGSVILLLSAFVGIQVRYFFGGEANIQISGFNYADYARRGFSELVIVAVISVALFVTLSLLSQRSQAKEKKWFSGLGIGLFALVGVVLLSAYQRLLLYESVFGFTRTRINAHAFMIWLGVFFVALIVLELAEKRRYFTLALLLTITAFGASINLLNVDSTIVRANAERLRASGLLDVAYLASLSMDTVPVLIDEIEKSTNEDSRQLLAALACQALRADDFVEADEWQSFQFSQRNARFAWMELIDQATLDRIESVENDNDLFDHVVIDGEAIDCWDYRVID
jgi:hypothetical protein